MYGLTFTKQKKQKSYEQLRKESLKDPYAIVSYPEKTKSLQDLLEEALNGEPFALRKYLCEKNLTKLDLHDAPNYVKLNIGKLGMVLIDTPVTSLNLESNYLSDFQFEKLLKGLKGSPVTEVKLGYNRIELQYCTNTFNVGKEYIKLLNDTNLTKIDFRSNQINDQGAEDFGNILKDLLYLSQVDLSGNRIGPEGIKNFEKALELQKAKLSKIDIKESAPTFTPCREHFDEIVENTSESSKCEAQDDAITPSSGSKKRKRK